MSPSISHNPGYYSVISAAFYLTKKHQINMRSYIKIPDVIAQVGGILSLFLPLLEIPLKIFIDNEYTLYLYKCLFKVQVVNDEKGDGDEGDIKDHNINNIKDFSLKVHKHNHNIQNENVYQQPDDSSLELQYQNKPIQPIQPIHFYPEQHSVIKSSNKQAKDRKSLILFGKNDNRIKDIVLNKEIDKIIAAKSKISNDIEITECNRLAYTYCCGKSKANSKANIKNSSNSNSNSDSNSNNIL